MFHRRHLFLAAGHEACSVSDVERGKHTGPPFLMAKWEGGLVGGRFSDEGRVSRRQGAEETGILPSVK